MNLKWAIGISGGDGSTNPAAPSKYGSAWCAVTDRSLHCHLLIPAVEGALGAGELGTSGV